MKNALAAAYVPDANGRVKVVVSTSSMGVFVNGLRKDGEAARAALLYLTGQAGQLGNQLSGSHCRGIVEAIFFTQAISVDAVKARDSALAAVEARLTEQLDLAYRRTQEFTAAREAFAANGTAALASFESTRQRADTDAAKRLDLILHEGAEGLAAAKTKLAEIEAQAKAQLSEFEKFYRESVAFAAPVKYWTDRAATSERLGRRLLVSAAAFGLATTGVVSWAMWRLVLAVGVPAEALHYRVALVGLIAFLLIWVLRVVVRMGLANLHQAMDAHERAVMVQTYQALFQDEKLSQEQRSLMLSAIFRHSATGLVRDDGAPPTPLEGIQRILSGMQKNG